MPKRAGAASAAASWGRPYSSRFSLPSGPDRKSKERIVVRSPVTAYVGAIAALGAALLLRWLLDPVMGNTLPLVTLFGAVAVAVWLGGYRPAILVVTLG